MTDRLIVGISGASGVIYGIRLLEALAQSQDIETHLVMSGAARATITEETDWTVKEVEALADVVHSPGNVGASIASGSFDTLGMIIAPCSIKTLSAIANSYDADLLTRAADVQLKEGRPVVLLLRETPLHIGHIKLMLQAAENGAIMMPPVPAFYSRPQTIDDLVNGTVGRALARIGVKNKLYFEWLGMNKHKQAINEPGQNHADH
jgi:flavin prenyltransferase